MRIEMWRFVIATWAVTGVIALFAEATVRLGRAAFLRLGDGLAPAEWAALVIVTAALGYVEGHRGFHCSFCPRVVERAFLLATEGSRWHFVFAPLYAMSLVGDSRTRMARSWGVMAAVVTMIAMVRHIPSTARGIVDFAVAASLAWGLGELSVRYAIRLRRELALRPEAR